MLYPLSYGRVRRTRPSLPLAFFGHSLANQRLSARAERVIVMLLSRERPTAPERRARNVARAACGRKKTAIGRASRIAI
jgi:hypothetical protein